jgi:hypothetical protein
MYFVDMSKGLAVTQLRSIKQSIRQEPVHYSGRRVELGCTASFVERSDAGGSRGTEGTTAQSTVAALSHRWVYVRACCLVLVGWRSYHSTRLSAEDERNTQRKLAVAQSLITVIVPGILLDRPNHDIIDQSFPRVDGDAVLY